MKSSRRTAFLVVPFALLAAFFPVRDLCSRDIVHVYLHSTSPDEYQLFFNHDGLAFSEENSVQYNLYPSELVDGYNRLNFAVPRDMEQFRLNFGTHPATIQVARVCLVRSFLVTTCVSGAELSKQVEFSENVVLHRSHQSLIVTAMDKSPFIVFTRQTVDTLKRSGRLLTLLIEDFLFLAASLLIGSIFCGLLFSLQSILRSTGPHLAREAVIVWFAAVALRCLVYSFFSFGKVPDSNLFLNYFTHYVFLWPGSRTLVYPLFAHQFGVHLHVLWGTQLLLGSVGAVLFLFLLRSLRLFPRYGVLVAVAATSIPTLLAFESLALAESLSLFLLILLLVLFRGFQKDPSSWNMAAGLGSVCALLVHTKPQFGYVPLLVCAAVIWTILSRENSRKLYIRQAVLSIAPLVALTLFTILFNFTWTNYTGTASTLGYSLFNNTQKTITCPTGSTDERIRLFCELKHRIGDQQTVTTYTADLMGLAMADFHRPFYWVTDAYRDLSFRLIWEHPGIYLRSVLHGFEAFWTEEPWMVRFFYGKGHPAASELALTALPYERWGIQTLSGAFFILMIVLLVSENARRRMGYAVADFDADFLLAALIVLIVLGSAVLQAVVESGENSRFSIPTLPLVVLAVAYLFRLWKSTAIPEASTELSELAITSSISEFQRFV